MSHDEVSVVVATRNRSRLALERAEWALAQPACREVIFVVDGAEDDTAVRLGELAHKHPHLKVIQLDERVGVPAAKNIGTQSASSPWVLLVDDDDQLSDGFLELLLKVAAASRADIVGAPWVFVGDGEHLAAAVHRAPRRPGGPLLDQPQIFPEQDWEECLWLPANSLISRKVFDKVSFDERYGGNFYREETDFFISAARAGFRLVVTSLAHCYLVERSDGGIERRSRVKYEYWVLRNNWRFLRKHGAWLRRTGAITSVAHHQSALCGRRMRPIARAAARRVLRKIRP